MPLLVPVIREAFENNGATKAEALRGKITIVWGITMKIIDHSWKDHTKIIILEVHYYEDHWSFLEHTKIIISVQ